MTPEAYEAFTDELVARASADERAIGLVVVGSTARRDYEPDAWSDHDFFLIVRYGAQQSFRDELSWLPDAPAIALSFQETEHGLKVLYTNGHLIEFAVFDPGELSLASVGRYRVLLDRGGVEERMRELAARPSRREPDDYLFGQLVTNVKVAMGRTARGETLSGRFFHVSATRHLCALLGGGAPLLDELDPLRRFERAYPELGAEIAAAEPRDLLLIARRELESSRPDLPWAALQAVLLEEA